MSYTDDYADSGRYSRADQQRRLAQLLAAQGASTDPIASPWQGAAKLAQALAGVLGNRAADKQEREQQAALVQAIAGGLGMLGGGGGATAPDTGPATTGSISGGDTGASGSVGSDYVASTEAYIRQQAPKYGIDPDVAVRVARSEGLAPNTWQSNVMRGGRRETSYGPFQMLVGGGMGDQFIKATGLNPRDPSTVNAQVDFALKQAAQGGWSPWYGAKHVGIAPFQGINRGGGQQAAGGTAAVPGVVPVGSAPTPDVAAFLGQGQGTQANPRVVYPPPQPPPQPVPNVGMGALTGSGTRPPIPGGPAEMMTPAPIGRGAVAQPVPGTPMPTRPTVTGYPAIAAQRIPPPTTPPIAATQVPPSVAAPSAQAPVATPQPNPIDARIAAAVPPGVPSSDVMPPVMSADLARLPQPRPPLPSMPPGQLLRAPIQPPAAPVARTPVPRPAPAVASPVVPSAAGPATTAAIPQQRGQIFREPAMSAQEFARQGQNYLTGRPSFANQQRVAPRTMQEPVAGMAGGAPVGSSAAAPASPRQGLIQRLFGGGGGGGAEAAQGAPAGSPVAGDGDPQRMALAQVLANPNMPSAVKAALIERFNPKPVEYGFTTLPDGTVIRTNPRAGTAEPTGISGGKTTHVLSPQERATYGISPDDPAVYQVDNTGKVDKVGGAGQTINVAGTEKGFDKTVGEGYGTSYLKMQEAGRKARTGLGTLKLMEQAVAQPGFYSGTAGQTVLQLKRAATALGLDPKGVADIESFNAMAKQAALDNMGGSLGSGFSNADRDFVTGQVPSLDNTENGNRKLIQISRKMQERNVEIAQRARDYAKAHDGRIDAGFDDELEQWAEANPVFGDMETAAPQAPQAATRRTATDPKTGQKVEWNGSAWVPAQ